MTIYALIGAGRKEVKVKQYEYPEIQSIVRIVSIMNVVNVVNVSWSS